MEAGVTMAMALSHVAAEIYNGVGIVMIEDKMLCTNLGIRYFLCRLCLLFMNTRIPTT